MSDTMSDPMCAKCKFFDPTRIVERRHDRVRATPDEPRGICRRNPPVPTSMHDPSASYFESHTSWPTVWSDEDWCGEFKDRA